MKAAVVHAFDRQLEIEDVPVPEPGAEQVLVRIEASGLRHTDIHAARGEWPVKPRLPFIQGTRASGIVERLGGEQPLPSRRECVLPCRDRATRAATAATATTGDALPSQKNTGYSINGGFAEYWVGYARHVVRVPAGIDPADAAPLTCAGVTTFKAVKGSGAGSSSLVAVFGAGGLGHLAIQYARVTGASVVAVDVNEDRLATAREPGASTSYTRVRRTGGRHPGPPRGGRGDLDRGDARGVRAGDRLAARGGTLVCVGLPPDNEMRVPIFETVLQGLTIRGVDRGHAPRP
jgi:alcohol dehydrogenase, propanol-preferring